MGGEHVLGRQHHDTGAFGKNDSLPIDAERPGCLGGILEGAVLGADVDGGQHIGKALNDLGDQAGVHAAGQDKVAIPVPDHAGPDTDGVIAGSAGALGRENRPGKTQKHAGFSGRQIGAQIGKQVGADPKRSPVHVIVHGDPERIRAV